MMKFIKQDGYMMDGYVFLGLLSMGIWGRHHQRFGDGSEDTW